MAENTTRWWEFYAVRYAMGAVVGTIALLFLCSQRPETQLLLPGTSISSPFSLDTPRLVLLAIYGLIYCYIASAPILVLHASRFLLKPDSSGKELRRAVFLYAVIPVLLGTCAYAIALHRNFEGRAMFTATVFALALLLEVEFVAVCLSVARNRLLFDFYVRLSRRRNSAKGEIVDSYRHLREHGNSFFIVFLEIALAIVLFEVPKLVTSKSSTPLTALWLAVLVIWIMPAVCVWLISTIFERRFSDTDDDTWAP
jgi:hypothetical protein